MRQYDASLFCLGMEVTRDEDIAHRRRVFLFRHAGQKAPPVMHHWPIHIRTRKVIVQECEVGDVSYVSISCSCGLFFQRLCACRHIYSLLNRPLMPDDVFPENHKSYEVLYGKDIECTEKCNKRTALLEERKGILVLTKLENILLNDAHQGNNLEWFSDTYHNTVDTNPNSNTDNIRRSKPNSTLNSKLNFETTALAKMLTPTGSPYVRHIKEFENIVNRITGIRFQKS